MANTVPLNSGMASPSALQSLHTEAHPSPPSVPWPHQAQWLPWPPCLSGLFLMNFPSSPTAPPSWTWARSTLSQHLFMTLLWLRLHPFTTGDGWCQSRLWGRNPALSGARKGVSDYFFQQLLEGKSVAVSGLNRTEKGESRLNSSNCIFF